MKRFYKTVRVAPANGGFGVRLDDKPVRTPSRAELVLPTQKLADAIGQEWLEQGDEIDMASMPMTRLAFAAIDTVPKQRTAMIEHLLGFARTDLVSYRAEFPIALIVRQAAAWDPLLEWMRENHGANIAVTSGIAHVAQPEESIVALSGVIASLNDHQLAALHAVTTVTVSLTIALALLAGRLTAAQAFEAAHTDEHFQAEQWGRDAEAENRHARLKSELEAAEKFLSLL